MSFDTGYNIDTVSKLLEFFISSEKIQFSEQKNELAIKNWNKYNGSTSPTVVSHVVQELTLIKDTSLIEYVYPNGTVPILDHNKNQNKKKKKKASPDGEANTDHNGNPTQDLNGMVW